MSLVKYQPVALEEVLCFLMARTGAASTMGMQLEQAEAIYTGAPANSHFGTANEMHVKAPQADTWKAQERAESSMLENISVSKCVDALGQLRSSRIAKDRPALAKLQKACPGRGQGELVVGCLRAYEEWRLKSGERALAAVYHWAGTMAPLTYPVALPEEHEDLAQAFRSGAAKRARTSASEIYGDCYLVLAEFVAHWNMRRSGVVTDSIGRRRKVAGLE